MARTTDISIPIYLGEIPIFLRSKFEIISQKAKSSGVSSYYLEMLCSWIESEEIDENDKLKCIECLIPKPGGTIPEAVCIRLTAVLMASQAPISIKVEILKWMVCAHSFMETSGRFQMCYEMFLMLLKNDEMRPYVAHFLSLITQKKHVTFRRFKCLSNLIDKHGCLPCLMLLRRVYLFHAPEYFEEELTEEHSLQVESFGAYPNLIKNVHHEYSPCLSHVLITTLENNSTTVSLEFDPLTEKIPEPSSSKLSPFHQLYNQFTALERCTDISKILQSKWSRLFFTSREFQCNPIMKTKVKDYIISVLHNALESRDIVERHLDLMRLQRSFPDISEFTEFLIKKNDWSPDLAEVMCFEPICCFKKIQYKLQVFRRKFLTTKDVGLKCQWLNSLSKMFCYWILQSKKPVPCDGTCNKDDSDLTPLRHIPLVEISQLGSEIDSLCDSLIMEDCSPFVLSQILEHYQMGALAHQLMETSSPCFPSPPVFQLSLFSLSPFLLETLSEFMLSFRHKVKFCPSIIEGSRLLLPKEPRKNFIDTYQKHFIGLVKLNAMHNSKILRNMESVIFQASMNDIKKIFFGGSYKSENTYLAKTGAFKKLNERFPGFVSAFILHKHPAFFLIAMEFCDGNEPEDFLTDPDNKKRVFRHLAESECQDFHKLISNIKIT